MSLSSTYLPAYLPIYRPIDVFILSIYSSTYPSLSTYLPLSTHLPQIWMSTPHWTNFHLYFLKQDVIMATSSNLLAPRPIRTTTRAWPKPNVAASFSSSMESLWLGRAPIRPSRKVLVRPACHGNLDEIGKTICTRYASISTVQSKGDAMCIVDSCDLWVLPHHQKTMPLQLRSRSSTSIPFCRSSFLNLSAWVGSHLDHLKWDVFFSRC